MCYCTPSIRTPFCSKCNQEMFLHIDRLTKQRDDMAATVEIMIIGACAVRIPHNGERKVLQEAVDYAREALTKVKGST